MKTQVTLFLVLISALTVWSFTQSGTGMNSLKWNETTHQFGDIPAGPEAVTTFTFKNKGKKAVQIMKVEPGCSCTVSDFSPNPVKRGKKGTVTAKYTTLKRPGYFKKFIKVTFTDSSEQELIITGNVVP